MAITPKAPGTVSPPNTLTSETEGAVTAPNNLTTKAKSTASAPNTLTSESKGAVAIPNNLTSKSQGAVSAPNNLTTKSASTASAPVNLTSESVATPAVPVNLTGKSAATVSAPVNLTGKTAATVSAPNTLTTKAAAAVSRALNPLVDMDFANQCYTQCGEPVTFDDLFTYTRASSATFINRRSNCNGGWEYFLDTDYVGSVTNLLTYSEQFDNAAWAKKDGSVSVVTTNIATVLGKAYKWTSSSDATTHLLSNDQTLSSGVEYTQTVVVKAGEYKYLQITPSVGFPTTEFITIDLNAGVIASKSANAVASVTPLGDGWYQCSMTETANATTTGRFVFALYKDLVASRVPVQAGEAGKGVYISAAQLTQSAKPLPYVKTISTSASKTFSESPRFEYDPATGEALGYLAEGGSTNLAIRSEEFDDSAWTTASAEISVSANTALAPDGTVSADMLTPSTTNTASHQILQTASLSDATTYTISIYAKPAGYNYLGLIITRNDGALASAYFDIAAGQLGATSGSNGSSITKLSGGWYRCSISFDAQTGVSANFIRVRPFNDIAGSAFAGNGSGGIYIWGAQIEAQSFATSYIRTGSAAVSRVSDLLKVPTAVNILPEFSVIAEVDMLGKAQIGTNGVFEIGTGSSGVDLRRTTANEFYLFSGSNPVVNTTGSKGVVPMAQKTIAVANNSQEASIYIDGSVYTGPAITSVADTSQIEIAHHDGTAARSLSGHTKQLTVYDVALTEQEIALL